MDSSYFYYILKKDWNSRIQPKMTFLSNKILLAFLAGELTVLPPLPFQPPSTDSSALTPLVSISGPDVRVSFRDAEGTVEVECKERRVKGEE